MTKPTTRDGGRTVELQIAVTVAELAGSIASPARAGAARTSCDHRSSANPPFSDDEP